MTFAEAVAKAATAEYMEHNGGKLCVRPKKWVKDDYVAKWISPCPKGSSWLYEGETNNICPMHYWDSEDWEPVKIPKPKPLSETLKCGDVVRRKDNHSYVALVTGVEPNSSSSLTVSINGAWRDHRRVDSEWELVP